MAGLVRTVNPTVLPLTVEDVKRFSRIDIPDDDQTVEDMIRSAVDRFEHVSGRALLTQTWVMTLDSFWGPSWDYTFGSTSGGNADQVYFDPRAGWIIQVPVPPLQYATSADLSIVYVDGNGNNTTLSPSAYSVDTKSEPGRISPVFGTFWPVARRQANAVTVTFKAGYGADGTSVPEQVKEAIRSCVAYRYEYREDADEEFMNGLFTRFQYGGC